EGKVLLDAVLEHAEVVLLEVRDVVSVAVRYRDAQRDEVNTGSKRRPRRTLTAAGRGLGRLGRADRDHSERGDNHHPGERRHRQTEAVHGLTCSRRSLTSVPRAVSPARVALTVTRSGGMSVCGRA